MNGLQTVNAPSASIVIPHFVLGSFAFVIMSGLLFFSAHEWMGLYFSPKLIAIIHIAVLGWATMIAFGALYQLIPIIYETALFSEKLVFITLYLYSISVILLSYSFWVASFSNLLFYTSLLMFFSLLLFIVNLTMTFRKRTKNNVQSLFVSTAIAWLALTEILGTLVALNFKFSFLNNTHLHYLKIHAHIGLVGWFLLLIIGASSILIPMFIISHQNGEKKLKLTYYIINIGLICLIVNWLFINKFLLSVVFVFIIIAGIINYLRYVYSLYKARIRKTLDTPMKLTLFALIILVVPLSISLLILGFKWDSIAYANWVIIYGFGIIFGLISTIVLGQIYKTLPFIVWLKIYQAYVGKYKTPLPRELYSENILSIMMYVYLSGFSILLGGLLVKELLIIKIGLAFIVLAALLNFFNVLKIAFHRQKLRPID